MRLFFTTMIFACFLSLNSLFAQPAGFEFTDVEAIATSDITEHQDNPSVPATASGRTFFEFDCDGVTQIAYNFYFYSAFPSILESVPYNDTSPVAGSIGSTSCCAWVSDGDRDGYETGIYFKILSYSSVVRVNNYTTGAQFNPDMASSSDTEHALIVWESDGQDGDGSGIYGRLVGEDGTFLSSEFQINSTTTNNQSEPAVAWNGSRYLVVWSSEQVNYGKLVTNYGIMGQFFDNDGAAIGSEFLISNDAAHDHTAPDVASDGTDFIVIAHADSKVVARKVGATGTLGSYFTVNDASSTLISSYASIASTGTSYLVVWRDNTDVAFPLRPTYSLHAQLLNPDSSKQDSNFTVNYYSVTSMAHPSVSANSSSYYLLWSSYHDSSTTRVVCWRRLTYTGLTIHDVPYTQIYGAGDNAVFLVRAETLNPPLHYQWYYDNDEVGTDSPTLTLTPADLPDQDSYTHVQCIISDKYGSYETESGDRLDWYDKSNYGYVLEPWFYIPESFEQKAYKTTIASNGSSFFAAWDYMTGDMTNQTDIKGMIFDNESSPTTSPVNINSTVAYAQSNPDSAFNGTYYLMVWQSYISGYTDDIIGQFYASDGTPVGSEIIINSTRSWYQKNPAIATDGTNFFVIWESYQQDSDGYAIVGCIVNGASMLPGSELVINQHETGNQVNADIASDGFNKYLAVWEDQGDYDGTTDDNIIGRYIYSNGTFVANEFMVNETADNSSHNPAIASSYGSFFIVWESTDSYGASYSYRRFIQADGTMDDVDYYYSDDINDVAIAANDYDYMFVQVRMDTFDGTDIYATRYRYDGTALSSQYIAIYDDSWYNSLEYTVDNVSITSNGKDFMVIWTLVDESGISKGVYGRKLTYLGPTTSPDCSDKIAYENENVTWHIAAEDPHGTVSYQWYYKGQPWGTNSPSTQVSNVQLSDDESVMYCVLTDAQASRISEVATLTVNSHPTCFTFSDEIRLNNAPGEWAAKPIMCATANGFEVFMFADNDSNSPYDDFVKKSVFNKDGEQQGYSSYIEVDYSSTIPLKVAYNGTHYLFVYARYDVVKGQLVDTSGNSVGSAFTINTTSQEEIFSIDVATDGSTFFITWSGSTDFFGDNPDIYARIMSDDGSFVTAEFTVANTTSTETATVAAYNGTAYLAGWVAGSNFMGQMYGPDGTLVVSTFTIASDVYTGDPDTFDSPDLITSSYNYFATWADSSHNLWIQQIGATGTLVGSPVAVATPAEYPEAYNPRLATTGSDFLVIWEDDDRGYSQYSPNSETDILAVLLDSSLDPIGSPFTVNTQRYGAQLFAGVVSDGSNYAICWESHDQDPDVKSVYMKTLAYSGLQLTGQPISITVHEDDTAVFVVSTGHSHGTLSYKWYLYRYPLKPLQVGSARVLYLYNVPYSSDGSEYYCVVSDDDGSVTSNRATLTVTPLLAITVHPQDQSCFENEPATFTVDTNYSDNLAYQWYQVASPVGFALTGEHGQQLTLEPTRAMNGNQYYCRVTRLGDTVFSDPATLTVIEPDFTVSINGPSSLPENSDYHGTGYTYNAYVDYGTGPVNETDNVTWELLTPEAGYMIGKRFYTVEVDENIVATIKATFDDGNEVHWATFDVTVTNFLQVTSMSPWLQNGMVTAPQNIEIGFSRTIFYGHSLSSWSLVAAGADGTFGTTDDVLVSASITSSDYEEYITIEVADQLSQDEFYRLTLDIKASSGSYLDGEFDGTLPSGNFSTGGEFVVDFSYQPTILNFECLDNDTVSIQWAPFSTRPMEYQILYTDDLTGDIWHSLGSTLDVKHWNGDDTSLVSPGRYYRVVGATSAIIGVTPNILTRGDTNVIVTIAGWNTHWLTGTVTVSFGDCTITNQQMVYNDLIGLAVSVPPKTTLGHHDITIECSDGTIIKHDGFEIVE